MKVSLYKYGHLEIYATSGDHTLMSRYLRDGGEGWSDWQPFDS